MYCVPVPVMSGLRAVEDELHSGGRCPDGWSGGTGENRHPLGLLAGERELGEQDREYDCELGVESSVGHGSLLRT